MFGICRLQLAQAEACFRVWDLEFRVYRAWVLGFRVWSLGKRLGVGFKT